MTNLDYIVAAVVCAEGFIDLGDISAVPAGRSVPMSCSACRVTWRGCADVYECPRCGAPQRFWQCWECDADHDEPTLPLRPARLKGTAP